MAIKLENSLMKNKGFMKMPPDKKEVFLDLARQFQNLDEFIYATPDELEEETGISSKLWEFFLDIETVRHYIKGRLTKLTEISHRKAIQALAQQAASGNVQAVKELNSLMNATNGENKTVVVLHSVPRPKTLEVE